MASITNHLASLPSHQTQHPPVKNRTRGAFVVYEPVPLACIAMDVMNFPRAWIKKVYRKACLVIDTFTKYAYVHPVPDVRKEHYESEQMVVALERFVAEVRRRVAKDPTLLPRRIITDKAATFTGSAFYKHIEDKSINHSGYYKHVCIPGTKSQANPAERAIQSYRRAMFAVYDAYTATNIRETNTKGTSGTLRLSRACTDVIEREITQTKVDLDTATEKMNNAQQGMLCNTEGGEDETHHLPLNVAMEQHDDYANKERALVRATKEVYSLSGEFMWPLQVGRVSQFINSKPHYGIALATPLEALDPDLPPSYATLHASQKKAATRRYANQYKDQVIRG